MRGALLVVAAVASTVTALDAARELLARRRARESLLAFTEYTHPSWRTEDHHVRICRRLEQLERREVCRHCGQTIDKLATFAPPRSGKTELALRRFAAWAMGRNPGWHTISAMANDELATDTGGEVRDIVKSPEYARIFPEVAMKPDAEAAGRWIVENAGLRGVYFCGGIGSAFPGRGANILNVDDPHKSAIEADSARMRDLAAKFYFGDGIQRLQHPSIQLLTNTRRHEDDLGGRILPPEREWRATDDFQFFCCDNGWHVLRLRAIEHEGTPHEYALRTMRVGPGEDAIAHMKALKAWYIDRGQVRHWNAEFQQNPVAEEGTYHKRHWYDDRYEAPPPGLWVYMTSDFAVTKERDGADPDFTEHMVYGLEEVRVEEERDDTGKVVGMRATAAAMYVLDWWYGQTGPDEWIVEWVRLLRKWQPNVYFGTKGVIRNAVEPMIKDALETERLWVVCEWLSDMRDKAAKGQAARRMGSVGRIRFPKHDPDGRYQRVIDNLVAFPTARHDDAFDAVSNAGRSLIEIPTAFVTARRELPEVEDPYEYADQPRRKPWKVA